MPVHYVCHRMDSCGGKCWYDNLIPRATAASWATPTTLLSSSASTQAPSCPLSACPIPTISVPSAATRWAARSATTYTNGMTNNDYIVTYPDAKYPAKSMLL
ncbi:MAG: hypothetical protein IKR50_05945 [Prevotella sp.]|nr:hypothetical protein [Prevotella sp.]